MPTILSTQRQRGFTLVEVLVALAIGVILIGAVISVYLAQSQVYKGGTSQASIQNAENAISALVTPTVRAAGFSGCGTLESSISNLAAGGPPPLGTLGNVPAMVFGYDASGTNGDPDSALVIAPDNPANSLTASDWSPALDASFINNTTPDSGLKKPPGTTAGDGKLGVLPGSDVLVVLGAVLGAESSATPSSQPAGVTVVGGTSVTVTPGNKLTTDKFMAVSDCLKSTVFRPDANAATSNVINHSQAVGTPLTNAQATFTVNYAPGAQLVQLQQTAFYVAQGSAGQSVLVRAIMNLDGSWTAQSLVPGVESMQVLYGVGANGVVSQYVPASVGVNWSAVYSVRLSFLIEGQPGSATAGTATVAPVLLGTSVTPPVDTRLRHVYEMTINLRNSGT